MYTKVSYSIIIVSYRKGLIDMQLSKDEYFFFEWLIIEKRMSKENFSELSHAELEELRKEWKVWFYKQ